MLKKEERIEHTNLLFKLIILVIIWLAGVGMLFPVIWALTTSLKERAQVWQYPPSWIPWPITLSNYPKVWDLINLGRAFINSGIVTSAVTLGGLFFSALAGFAFAHYRFPGRNIIFFAILSTIMVPVQIRLIPTFLIIKWIGWVDTYQALILPLLGNAFGIFLMRQFLQAIPGDLFDSARIDGSSEFRIFLQIVMPLCKPALATLGIFIFMGSWNNFIWPLIVVKSEEMETVPLVIAGLGSAATAIHGWPVLIAGVMLVVIPVLLVFIAFQNYFVRGITLSGLKG